MALLLRVACCSDSRPISLHRLEAAVEFHKAKLRVRAAASTGTAPPTPALDEWSSWVDGVESKPTTKCLARTCIEGLETAVEHAQGGERAAELSPPHSSAAVLSLLRAPVPTVLRGAAAEWGPTLRWDAAHLRSVAGDEELEVTVVTTDGAFEVRSRDRPSAWHGTPQLPTHASTGRVPATPPLHEACHSTSPLGPITPLRLATGLASPPHHLIRHFTSPALTSLRPSSGTP
jgi:hypothetical protein